MTTASAPALASSSAASLALRVPASFFSMVLGLAGLAGAWRNASRAYGVSPWLADGLLAVAAALWVVLFAAQVVKAISARARLGEELADPVRGSLATLAPTSLLLLAAGISAHYRDLALVLFWIGAAGQLAHGAFVVGGWFIHAVEPRLVTPAMYLPPVAGNLVAAIAAGALGKPDLAGLFFGAGVIAWMIVGAVLLGRYLSAGELPAAVRPLVGIEIAPPAVALVAWQAFEGTSPDTVSRALLGFTLFQALVVLRFSVRLRDVPFAPSYWAFTFPLAALASGALRQGAAAPDGVAGALGLPLFVVANAVVAVIAFRTVMAASRGNLLSPE